MPIVDASDPKVWTAQYVSRLNHPSDRFGPAVPVGFLRSRFLTGRKRRGASLVRALKILDGQAVAVVGSAWCWTGEGIAEALPASTVFGIDNSKYVQATKDQDETAEITEALLAAGLDPAGDGAAYIEAYKGEQRSRLDILDIDILDRQALKVFEPEPALDWAISDDVLPWLSDGEALELDRNMRRISTKVAHFVTPWMEDQAARGPEPEPLWNWKTVEAWRDVVSGYVLSYGELNSGRGRN